mgnify:CR=1 FL=1
MSDIIKLNSWKEVTEYIDNGFWQPTPSYFEHIVQHNSYYPNHAFSKGQLASKSWLLEKLHKINWRHQPNSDIVVILGSWIGAMVEPLHKTFDIERIYGIDTDAIAIEKSEKLNQKFVQDKWKYKGVVHNVDLLECDNMQFETSGELINCKPNWIINTSCEHIKDFDQWYSKIPAGKLVILQSNNYYSIEEHVNCVDDNLHFEQMAPLSEVYFAGDLPLEKYTRYMRIGRK